MDPKQKFYRHFLDNVAELQELIDQLHSVSVVAGERQEAIDHVLAGINKLQQEVSDAAEYTPSYDLKQYSASIKSLQDKLDETLAKVTPKSRFQFRRSSIEKHVDMGAPENDPRLYPGSLSRNMQNLEIDKIQASVESNDMVGDLPSSGDVRDCDAEMSKPSSQIVRELSFIPVKTIGVSDQSNLHIILPSSADRATVPGSLTELKWCIVNMSVPTAEGRPFPCLALKNISHSLIITGHIDGPVRMTGVTDSIIVTIARQVRVHDCKNVDIYLHCISHPIIEDCLDLRFAPLPECFPVNDDFGGENQWNRINDFKWVKAGKSPNWKVLPDSDMLDDTVWTRIITAQPGKSVEEILQQVGIPRH